MPNNSMDVRAKQRLCYQHISLNSELRVAVSPHVISIVRLLRMMKIGSFWKPFVVSLIAMPIILFFVILFAGGGHGTYFPAKVFFPYTMISAIRLGTITVPFICLSLVQFPIYGFALGIANKKGYLVLALSFILFLHVVALALCFWLPSENF